MWRPAILCRLAGALAAPAALAVVIGLASHAAGPERVAAPAAPDQPVLYVVFQEVRDAGRFLAYVQAVKPAIERRGGALIAAGPPAFTEGHAPYGRAAVFRYPSRVALEGFLRSEEYARIRRLRVGAADWLSAIVPALPDAPS